MKKTKHFAAVIGAAGIMVGPFITTVAAHADDSVAVDPAGYAQAEGALELDFSATLDGPTTIGDVIEAGVAEDLAPVVSQAAGAANAAASGILIVNDTIIPFDVMPEDVIAQLPAPGTITEAEYSQALAAIAPYAIAEDEQILAAQLLAAGETEVMLSLPFGGDINWTVSIGDNELMAAPAAFVDVVIPEEVAEPEVAAEEPAAAAPAAEAENAGGTVADSVQGEAPAAVAPAAVPARVTQPVTTRPTLPTTGVDKLTSVPLAKTGAAPFAAILAAAGLMGSGAGMVRLRRKNTED